MLTFLFKKLVCFILTLLLIFVNTKSGAADITLDITLSKNLKYDSGFPVKLIDSISPTQTNVIIYLRVFDGTFENGMSLTPWIKVWDNGLLNDQLKKISVINPGSNYNIYSYIEAIPTATLGISSSGTTISNIYEGASFESFASIGDELLSINNVTVSSPDDINKEMSKYKPGDCIVVRIQKKDNFQEIVHKVILGDLATYY